MSVYDLAFLQPVPQSPKPAINLTTRLHLHCSVRTPRPMRNPNSRRQTRSRFWKGRRRNTKPGCRARRREKAPWGRVRALHTTGNPPTGFGRNPVKLPNSCGLSLSSHNAHLSMIPQRRGNKARSLHFGRMGRTCISFPRLLLNKGRQRQAARNNSGESPGPEENVTVQGSEI